MKTEKQHFVYHSDNRFTLVGIVEENSLKLGLAVCRDGDQFSRKMGRTIAYGRAEKKPFDVVVNVPQDRMTDLFYSGAIQMAEERVNLINARLYFKGTWHEKYLEGLTKESADEAYERSLYEDKVKLGELTGATIKTLNEDELEELRRAFEIGE